MRVRTKYSPVLALALALIIGAASLMGITPQAHAAGPCVVNGFTNHAKLRMSERYMGEGSIRDSVSTHCSSGVRQSDGTWIYESHSAFLPTVVLNGNGFVITAWWPDAGGGGGGGSWSTPTN